jgi:flagellar biosynthesis GTPase FlhF
VSAASATPAYDIRGEWQYSLTCSCGQNAPGTLLLGQEEPSSGAYSGTTVLDGLISGTASGTITGSSLALEIVLPHAPPSGEEFTFTVASGTLESAKNEFSGSGSYGASAGNATGEIKAKRVRTLAQIEQEEEEAAQRAKEAKEKAEKEAKEKAEKEAEEKPLKEKAEAEQHEREAKEKAEKEAKEKQQAKEQQEAKERQQTKEQQEAKARQEAKEREEKASKEAPPGKTTRGSAPLPAKPNTKTLAVSNSGLVSFELSNLDNYAISGDVTLMAGTGAKASGRSGKHKSPVLAESPFSLSSYATKVVKLKLSKSATAELARRRSLRLAIRITTRAAGHPPVTKTYNLALHAAGHRRH